jgi:hypothetical protein
MSIRIVTPDIQKAKTLVSRAEEFLKSIQPIMNTAEVSFLLNGEYDILHALAEALLAFQGEKVTDKDHHKALIQRIAEKYSSVSPAKINTFEELRKIRNDINYYGQKDKKTLEDFYKRNKETIKELREMLFHETKAIKGEK